MLAVVAVLALPAAAPILAAAASDSRTPPAAETKPPPAPTGKASAGTDASKGGTPAADAAKNKPARVEVASVHFSNINPSGNSAFTWNETDIEINVRPSAVKGDSRFVNRVRITLTLEAEGPGIVGSAYYRTSVEAVALEVGRSDIRFYLPPEIVRRDKLRAEPKVYAVEISVGGQDLTPSKTASNAPDPRAFLAKAVEEATANNGILQPQYLTNFAFDSARPAPAFIRP